MYYDKFICIFHDFLTENGGSDYCQRQAARRIWKSAWWNSDPWEQDPHHQHASGMYMACQAAMCQNKSQVRYQSREVNSFNYCQVTQILGCYYNQNYESHPIKYWFYILCVWGYLHPWTQLDKKMCPHPTILHQGDVNNTNPVYMFLSSMNWRHPIRACWRRWVGWKRDWHRRRGPSVQWCWLREWVHEVGMSVGEEGNW